jgi:hypothetical protein
VANQNGCREPANAKGVGSSDVLGGKNVITQKSSANKSGQSSAQKSSNASRSTSQKTQLRKVSSYQNVSPLVAAIKPTKRLAMKNSASARQKKHKLPNGQKLSYRRTAAAQTDGLSQNGKRQRRLAPALC